MLIYTLCLVKVYSAPLTCELQRGFPAQNGSHAVLRPALVLPKINAFADVYYHQTPINQTVAWLRLNPNICPIDHPAVKERRVKRMEATQVAYWNTVVQFYLKLFPFTLLYCWKLTSLIGNGALYISRLDRDIDLSYEPWLNCISVWQLGQIP